MLSPSRRARLVSIAALLSGIVVAVGSRAGQACEGASFPSITPAPQAASGPAPPNLVLIVTDDQRWDTLFAMPNVRHLLGDHGVTFSNAFVTTPVCCPARTSMLTGQYSRHTGVLDNQGPHGGAPAFSDRSTLATWLSGAGYETALVGKYLNGYPQLGRCYIPPGWSEWDAIATGPFDHYYNYSLSENGRLVPYGAQPADYQTTVLADRSKAFIAQANRPFFLYFAPSAPHRPANPAPQDVGAFDPPPPFHPPSYDERNISDKPWDGSVPPLDPERMEEIAGIREHMLESLRSLDRTIGGIVGAIQAKGVLDNTVIAFTSDNGFLWGEHRLVSKAWPYEESIRVPLVFRVPWVAEGAGRTDPHLALNIDLASTFSELAGVKPGLPQDGRSLVPLLRGQDTSWRHAFDVEWLGRDLSSRGGTAPYEGLRTNRYVYVEYTNGWRELYDLRRDPAELRNLAEDPKARALRSRLAARLHASLST
ncbi:MAG: sulfatase [Actinomycetota bacterium]|nr:sulfatase [Actinomycetota bacterium]